MKWENVTIGQLVEEDGVEIQTGPFGTQLKASDYVVDGIPVINVRNIGYGLLQDDKLEFISDQTAERLGRHLLMKDDIVFGRKGAVDRHLLVRDNEQGWLQGSDCIRLRVNTDKLRPNFLSYQLLLPYHKQWILNQSGNKSTMASLNQDVIKRISLSLPSASVQDRIVEVLKAYDDLIENNRRRIELLEQAARLLYKEWFVHFRFPGHEHVKIVDGVPEGWENGSAADAMDILSGGTPKTTQADYWDGDTPLFTPKDSTDSLYVMATEKTITDKGLQSCNSKLYPKDTVFITARGTVGKVNLAQVPMAMNQSCYALVAKAPVNQYYLYFALVEGVHKFKSQASGAVFDAIVRDTFKRIPFLVPHPALIDQFTFLVEPVIKQVENLTLQNQKLKVARDLLLPRLMNGEIAI